MARTKTRKEKRERARATVPFTEKKKINGYCAVLTFENYRKYEGNGTSTKAKESNDFSIFTNASQSNNKEGFVFEENK